ncbi:MAG: YwbE family protein [Methanoregula sp.]|nr:YwbE family protein [Methanoregula sp.]MDP3395971.1 YwbE family protein [Methanoregula sp.]
MPMPNQNEGRNRLSIQPGCTVDIIQKQDQRTGKKTRGIVQEILTNSPTHPHGIKVRLKDGCVGRVTEIIKSDGA